MFTQKAIKHLSPLLALVLLLTTGTGSLAQQSFRDLLKMKTESQIKEIINASPAITGLMVIDLTTGESFGNNVDMVFPTASAIKVPVLMEVFKQASQKKFALTDVLKLEQRNTVAGSGILKDMEDPVSLSIRNYCLLMMSLSDNSATNTILDLVTLKSINATLDELGFTKTRVQRKMIDIAASGRGEENISTPAEAAKIMRLLFNGDFIDKKICSAILSLMSRKERSDSRLATYIPATVPVIFKPGLLTGVSTEWAIFNLKERPYVIVMMENFKIAGKSMDVMEKVSEIVYQHFWRLGNSTKYGSYIDPALIKAD